MIDAPYLEAHKIVHSASRGEISPREAEWALIDMLGEAGQDVEPRAADLIDTALALLGEWDRGDRTIEDLLAALSFDLGEDAHQFDVRDNQLLGEQLGIRLGVEAA